MNLAISSDETMVWQFTLVAGAVVLVAVIALLGLLYSFVCSIETSVRRLSDVAQGVAGNTANITAALGVIATLDEVTDEARRHARLLGVGA